MSVTSDPEFDAVYRANVGLVWRSLRRAGVADGMLEDATQEVFLIHHRRRAEFAGASSVRTWLLGIARGVAANIRRGEQRLLRRLEARRVDPTRPAALDVEHRAAQAEALSMVESFLATLRPEAREVFELIEIEDLKQREVAELLDVNINTVASRLRAGRAAFTEFVRALETKEAAHG